MLKIFSKYHKSKWLHFITQCRFAKLNQEKRNVSPLRGLLYHFLVNCLILETFCLATQCRGIKEEAKKMLLTNMGAGGG